MTIDLNTSHESASMDQETRTWALLLHLSILLTFPLPIIGLIVPILIWQLKKEQLPGIDAHGKNVANFLISTFIYGIVASILVFLLVGIPLLIVLAIVTVVFPIIAAIKANSGEYWDYPLTIKFFR